jgi:hypothetical protein
MTVLLQPPIRRCDTPTDVLRSLSAGQARPSDRQRTAVSTPPVFGAPRARLAWRLGAFVTNRHE